MHAGSENIQCLPLCFVREAGTEVVQSNTSSRALHLAFMSAENVTNISCWRFKHGPMPSDKLGPRISWKPVLGLWEECSFTGLGWEAKKRLAASAQRWKFWGWSRCDSVKFGCVALIHTGTKEILHLENSQHQDWQAKKYFPTRGTSFMCLIQVLRAVTKFTPLYSVSSALLNFTDFYETRSIHLYWWAQKNGFFLPFW